MACLSNRHNPTFLYLERMAAYPLVLAAQDTSFLNYTHHPATSGLGPIGSGQRGLVMHSTTQRK
jgi:hypothetical protein